MGAQVDRYGKIVLEPETVPVHARILSADNLEGGTFLDSAMQPTGSARTDHLGRVGAEIAAPLN